MYPLVKDKLRETEKRINEIKFYGTTYQCQDCGEFFESNLPYRLNGVPICDECWNKKEFERVIYEK